MRVCRTTIQPHEADNYKTRNTSSQKAQRSTSQHAGKFTTAFYLSPIPWTVIEKITIKIKSRVWRSPVFLLKLIYLERIFWLLIRLTSKKVQQTFCQARSYRPDKLVRSCSIRMKTKIKSCSSWSLADLGRTLSKTLFKLEWCVRQSKLSCIQEVRGVVYQGYDFLKVLFFNPLDFHNRHQR